MNEQINSETKTGIGPFQLMARAVTEFADKIHVLPMFGKMIEATRLSEDRKQPAIIKMMVPDDWVKNVNGNRETQDFYYLIRVPRLVEQIIRAVKPEDESSTDTPS